MPELPEVETVRRALYQAVQGQTIQQIDILFPKIVDGDSQQFCMQLKGNQIKDIQRRGKYLIFVCDKGYIISHLRMTGKYFVTDTPEPFSKHVHIMFHLNNGKTLHYEDVRKFGRLEWIENVEEYFTQKKLGVEPTKETFEQTVFYQQLQKSTQMIKVVLLNQKIVAGLGNIYVDEVLYQSGILPTRHANSLTQDEVSKLHQAILLTIEKAIKAGGTTIRDYTSLGKQGSFQQQLFVYGQNGKACVKCGSIIEKIVVGQRGTHFCPNCQQ